MPLMHSEKLEAHNTAVKLIEGFVKETKLLGETQLKGMLNVQDFLNTHMKIIE